MSDEWATFMGCVVNGDETLLNEKKVPGARLEQCGHVFGFSAPKDNFWHQFVQMLATRLPPGAEIWAYLSGFHALLNARAERWPVEMVSVLGGLENRFHPTSFPNRVAAPLADDKILWAWAALLAQEWEVRVGDFTGLMLDNFTLRPVKRDGKIVVEWKHFFNLLAALRALLKPGCRLILNVEADLANREHVVSLAKFAVHADLMIETGGTRRITSGALAYLADVLGGALIRHERRIVFVPTNHDSERFPPGKWPHEDRLRETSLWAAVARRLLPPGQALIAYSPYYAVPACLTWPVLGHVNEYRIDYGARAGSRVEAVAPRRK